MASAAKRRIYGPAGRSQRRMKARTVVTQLLMIWILAVTLFFLWEAYGYRGLYQLVAEWQLEKFGHYLPILSFSFLVAIFSLPGVWLLKSRKIRGGIALSETRQHRFVLQIGNNFQRVLFALSGALFLASLVTLLWTLTLPTFKSTLQRVAISSGGTPWPTRGAVSLTGQVLYQRTAAYSQDMFFKKRGVRFAPMIMANQDGRSIRYFVELMPNEVGKFDPQKISVSTRRGLLMPNSLPGSIVRLYQYAGFQVEKPHFVLYASTSTMRWPYFVTAIQLAFAAIFVLLAALIQQQHVRKVDAKWRGGSTGTNTLQ